MVKNCFHTILLLAATLSTASLQADTLTQTSASSMHSAAASPDNVIDGNWISRWQAKGEGTGAWWQVTFPCAKRIGTVVLIDGVTILDNISSVRLDFSDGSSFDYTLPISTNYPGPKQPGLIPTPDDLLDRNTIVSAMPTAVGLKDANAPKSGPHWIRFEPRETSFIKVTVTDMVNPQQDASLAQVRWIEVPEADAQPAIQFKRNPDNPDNLAFVGNGAAVATATDHLGDYHHPSLLNDGTYGNASCWISQSPASAATIDFGKTVTVGQFRFGRDRDGVYADRAVQSLTIDVADEAGNWKTVYNNANLSTIPGYSANETTVIDIEPEEARMVRVTMDPAQGGIDEFEVYAPAADQAENLPNVGVQKNEGVDPRIHYTAYGLTTGRPAEPWVLTNREFVVEISPASGTITRWTSLDPTPVDLVSPASGMQPYVRNIDRGWQEPFDRLHAWQRGQGIEDGMPYDEVTCIVFPETRTMAYARLIYRMYEDRFTVQVRYTSLVNDWSRYVFGVASELDREQWPEHRDSAGFMPTDTTYIRSYDHAYDICWEQGDWTTLVYPMGVYRRDDRLLMYGSFDLANHLVFAPNIPSENAHPSVLISPLGLTEGQRFEFNLFAKTFPRATSGWMEALRWYAQRTYAHDPDLQGIPLRLTRTEPATIDPGIVGAWPILRREQEDPAELERWKSKMLDLGINNLLYGGWFLWVDSPDRFDSNTVYGMFSADKWATEIEELQSDGFTVYTYMNNFVRAPWVPDPRFGGHLVDMDNDVEREWYIERAKSLIRTLRPAGIFWDTGWWPPMYAAGNQGFSSDPRGSSVMGWVKMQAIIYHWVKENFPEMKVMANNMAGGSPSCFFADGTMVEDGGDATNPLIVEDTRALLLTPYSYNSIFYYDMFARVLQQEGLTLADVKEAGELSRELRDKVWTRWIHHALESLGLGLPIHLDVSSIRGKFNPQGEFHTILVPFKRSEQMREVALFSALANGTPHMAYTHVLSTDVPDTFGAVWSNEERLMASLYNDSETSETVTARIDRKILGTRQPNHMEPRQSWIISSQGIAQPDRSMKISLEDDYVVFAGELGPGEAALLQIGR